MLTGETRFRVTRWLGKLVLQVEYYPPVSGQLVPVYTAWRDATIADQSELLRRAKENERK